MFLYNSFNIIWVHSSSIWSVVWPQLSGDVINGWVQLVNLFSKLLALFLQTERYAWVRGGGYIRLLPRAVWFIVCESIDHEVNMWDTAYYTWVEMINTFSLGDQEWRPHTVAWKLSTGIAEHQYSCSTNSEALTFSTGNWKLLNLAVELYFFRIRISKT